MADLERLIRIIERLPDEKRAELERLAIAMLPESGPDDAFEGALARTFETFDSTLRRLAQ